MSFSIEFHGSGRFSPHRDIGFLAHQPIFGTSTPRLSRRSVGEVESRTDPPRVAYRRMSDDSLTALVKTFPRVPSSTRRCQTMMVEFSTALRPRQRASGALCNYPLIGLLFDFAPSSL